MAYALFIFFPLKAFGGAEGLPGESSCKIEKEVSLRDIMLARRESDEFRTMMLRLRGVNADQKLLDNFYTPIFKLNGRLGKHSTEEYNEGKSESQRLQSDVRNDSLGIAASQRLPGGASLELSLLKELGRGKNSNDLAGDSTSQDSQYSYRLEARQPLLRGGGAAASVDLSVGELTMKQSRLTHEIFMQEDLLKTVRVYSQLISGRQNVLQAERSLKASKDFLSVTQAQVSQGVLAKSEIDQAQFAVSQGELELAYAQQSEKDAVDQLLVFSGLAVTVDQPVRGFPEVNVGYLLNSEFPELAEEIEVAQINVRIAELQSLTAKDNNSLELNLVGSIGRGWGSRYHSSDHERGRESGWRSESYVGLEMSKTLNDYSARASLRKSRLAVDEKQLELQDAKLRLKVRRAGVVSEFSSAGQYLELIKKKIEVAGRTVENERFKIEIGRSTAFMVYAAQSNLAQAQSEYISATSRYIIAAAQFYKELGGLPSFVQRLIQEECSSS